VPRLQIEEIKKQIIAPAGKNPICLHGVAGIGKSTTAKQIATLLPDMSETVLLTVMVGELI
jgi:predicted ATPase with chaperone activity